MNQQSDSSASKPRFEGDRGMVPKGNKMLRLTRAQYALLYRAWESYRVEFDLGDGYDLKDRDLGNTVIDLRRKITAKSYDQLEDVPHE